MRKLFKTIFKRKGSFDREEGNTCPLLKNISIDQKKVNQDDDSPTTTEYILLILIIAMISLKFYRASQFDHRELITCVPFSKASSLVDNLK